MPDAPLHAPRRVAALFGFRAFPEKRSGGSPLRRRLACAALAFILAACAAVDLKPKGEVIVGGTVETRR